MIETTARRALSSLATLVLVFIATVPAAAQRGANNPFPGGENPDGSLKPSARLTRLFSQDAYTEYALLEPGSEQFRIRFLTEETRPGSTELVNATRGGSEGTDVEVYDPRTGKPLPFTYDVQGETHAIHAKLTTPVPRGRHWTRADLQDVQGSAHLSGLSRGRIRPFGIQDGDISWVRSLAGYRLGVILPKGFAFLSSNVAAQMSTLPDGRLELHFANPSGLSNPLTIHARKTTATPDADAVHRHVLRRREDALRSRSAGDASGCSVEQIYSDFRKGAAAGRSAAVRAARKMLVVVDLDTAKPLADVEATGRRRW